MLFETSRVSRIDIASTLFVLSFYYLADPLLG